MNMARWLSGLVILLVAVGLCWADVTVGQAHAGSWIAGLIGPARATGDAPLAETLFTLIIYGPLVVIAAVGGAIERRNPLALGARPAANLVLGLVAGIAGLTVAVAYAQLAGALSDGPGAGAEAAVLPFTLLWGVAVVAVQAGAEEVFFRGWLQPALTSRWGWVAGIVASALAFAALHVAGGARAPISLLNLFLGGLTFGLFAARGGGLAAAFGAHWAWNASEQLGWGLDPNPGIGSFGALIDKELAGRAIWGGSNDGLNGSFGMTVALLAILVPLAAISWRRLPATARPSALSPSGSPG